ncbi:MAG: ABC-2 family transporter protein [Actinomycetota bacterium]
MASVVTEAASTGGGLLGSLGLYRRLVAARISGQWQYRTSFVLFLVGQAAVTGFDLIALLFTMRLVPDLGGWTTSEVVLLYALATVPFGVTDTLVSPIERLSHYVQTGEFDRLLLRPASAMLQLAALEFELRRAGKALPALGALVWVVAMVDVVWTPARIGALVAALLFGSVIYTALWILASSISFWATAAREATNALTYGGQTASQYPHHLYRPWLRLFLGWAFPLAFVAYVPTQHLTDAANPLGLSSWLIYLTPLVAAGALAVAAAVWRQGILHYTSTGS